MAPTERTIGQLLTDAVSDAQSIIEHHKALAQAEIAASARYGGAGAGLIAAAVSLLGLSVIYLLVAAAQGLIAAGLPPWAGYLVVGGTLVLLALLFAGIGAALLRRVKPPTRVVEAGQRTVADLRTAILGHAASAPDESEQSQGTGRSQRAG